MYFRFGVITTPIPTRQKLKRNKIYKLCDAATFVAFASIGLLAWLNRGASIFWPETLAMVAFAAAWLVKGQTVLRDGAA